MGFVYVRMSRVVKLWAARCCPARRQMWQPYLKTCWKISSAMTAGWCCMYI